LAGVVRAVAMPPIAKADMIIVVIEMNFMVAIQEGLKMMK
jgi:hypothetical protein